MSADVWLVDADGDQVTPRTAGWDAALERMYPTRAPSSVLDGSVNLTYNLSPMLWAAGMPPWPEMMGRRADDAGAVWEATRDELRGDPDLYKTLNPDNGWGDYDQAVKALDELARLCETFPAAVVGGWL